MIESLATLARRLQSRFGRAEPFQGTSSYSQCGEDRIAALIFHALGIRRPTYLDVGANEPVSFSNTYLFYRHGCKGVCVEANPALCAKFRRVRSRDTCVNIGVGPHSGGTMTLHVFEDKASGLTTFSEAQVAAQLLSGSHKVARTMEIPIVSLNDFVRQHFPAPPNFLSIDIEGLEVEVLEPFDFDAHGPDVICAETLRRNAAGQMEKNTVLSGLIESRGYRPFADTYINTVFVKATRFPQL